MKHKMIPILLVTFLIFKGSALAQIEVTKNFTPITEDFCWMKECKAKDTSFALKVLDLWKEADVALAEGSSDSHSGFYFKSDPAAELDTGIRSLNQFPQSPDGQDSVLVKQLDEVEDFSAQSDSFRYKGKGLGAKLLQASTVAHTVQMINLMSMVAFPDAFNYSCSSWTEAKSNLHRAWTSSPVWDKDPWMTNFIGHPYAGGFYYNMLRSQGASPRTSFLYSTGQSLLWEFVVEAVAEQPSIQDLLFTSNLGSVVGELSHRATIRMGRDGFSTLEKILTTLINPVYVFNNGFRKHYRTSHSPF